MILTELTIADFKSYEGETKLNFSPTINLLVGPNNSGKSAIIGAIRLLQGDNGNFTAPRLSNLVRLTKTSARLDFLFESISPELRAVFNLPTDWVAGGLRMTLRRNEQVLVQPRHPAGSLSTPPNGLGGKVLRSEEPHNAFYYYLSQRKPYSFQGQIGRNAESYVRDNLMFLTAKIDKNASLGNPNAIRYQEKIESMAGTKVCAAGGANENQKVAGAFTRDAEHFVEIEDMGSGIPQMAAIVADLVVAKGKIFLIEELENDLHPNALIKLLGEIRAASEKNQFIISTHSNIVVSRLGSIAGAKIFSTKLKSDCALPTTALEQVPETAAARALLLENLGYSFGDLGLMYVGYLILEESTAERIVRDFLIPQFAPRLLGKLRVFPSGGLAKVAKRFEAIQSLFVFLHTSGVYKNTTWVRVDAGEESAKVVSLLRGTYKALPDDRFGTWEKERFEDYYPKQFSERVTALADITDWQQKTAAKGKLAEDVVLWSLANAAEARDHFAEKAREVIACLRTIEAQLNPDDHAPETAKDT